MRNVSEKKVVVKITKYFMFKVFLFAKILSLMR